MMSETLQDTGVNATEKERIDELTEKVNELNERLSRPDRWFKFLVVVGIFAIVVVLGVVCVGPTVDTSTITERQDTLIDNQKILQGNQETIIDNQGKLQDNQNTLIDNQGKLQDNQGKLQGQIELIRVNLNELRNTLADIFGQIERELNRL